MSGYLNLHEWTQWSSAVFAISLHIFLHTSFEREHPQEELTFLLNFKIFSP